MSKPLLEFQEYFPLSSTGHSTIPNVLVNIIQGYYLDLSLPEPLKKEITEHKSVYYRWCKPQLKSNGLSPKVTTASMIISHSQPFTLEKMNNYRRSNPVFYPTTLLTEGYERMVWVHNSYKSIDIDKKRIGQYTKCDHCENWHNSEDGCIPYDG